MAKTIDNLKTAFAGESQASRRYVSFGKKAEEEGFPQIGKLFRAASESETVHASNHLRIMGEIKSTRENVEAAISGETQEFRKMYPEFEKIAQKEGEHQASWSFDTAGKVEQVHAGLFQKALEALRSVKELEKIDYYICGTCGNTVEKAPPEKCPICGAPRKMFFKVA